MRTVGATTKGPATRNDFVNDIVNDARADAMFATLKAIVDDEKSTISSTISLRVAWPLDNDFRFQFPGAPSRVGGIEQCSISQPRDEMHSYSPSTQALLRMVLLLLLPSHAIS